MRERKWYSRFGIEPPFPWAILLWPFLWLKGALAVAG